MNKKQDSEKTVIQKAVSIFFALILWHIISVAVGMDMLLASPVKVAVRLCTIWLEEGFF